MGKKPMVKKKKKNLCFFVEPSSRILPKKLKDRNGIFWWMEGKGHGTFWVCIFSGCPRFDHVWPNDSMLIALEISGPFMLEKELENPGKKTRKPTMNKDWDRKWHEAQLTLRCNFNWNILLQKQLLTNGKSMEHTGKSREIWLITCKVPIRQKIKASSPLFTENTSPVYHKQFTSSKTSRKHP